MKKPSTPFPTTGYYGPDYFCDREEELKQLLFHLHGGNSTTLVAIRRLGKTALIQHLFQQMEKKYLGIYADILPTESLNDLLNLVASSITRALPERSSAGKKVMSFIRSLRPTMSYDTLSGAPIFSFRTGESESKRSVEELLQLLEQHSDPVAFAIDEFQQILNYPEKQADAWLRSVIQGLRNVSFIFSGSQQHVMQDMFTSPNKPFYRSTQMMKIGKIDPEKYKDFIVTKFSAERKDISNETAGEILAWTNGHTYYVQLLCNRVFLSSGREITSETWKSEAASLLKEQEFVFYGYRELLTRSQWELLKAIAREGEVAQPTSNAFISSHQLGNPASVLRSLQALQNKELVYSERGEDGASYYSIYDVLFQRWIE